MRKSVAPREEARKAGSADNDAEETPPQDYTSQRVEPAASSKYRRSSRYTLRKALRVRFCHIFPKNWIIKTCTGSQEEQRLWQIEAVFQLKKP